MMVNQSRSLADARKEAARAKEQLRRIAKVAHEGGAFGFNENTCLTEIRNLSLPYWDGKAKKSFHL